MHCIENLHIQACKRVLNVNKSSSNDAVLSDLGRFPLHINASKRYIKFWLRILKLPINRYARLCYDMLKLYDTLSYTKWVTSVRTNLYTNVFGYIWENQTEINDIVLI